MDRKIVDPSTRHEPVDGSGGYAGELFHLRRAELVVLHVGDKNPPNPVALLRVIRFGQLVSSLSMRTPGLCVMRRSGSVKREKQDGGLHGPATRAY
jgi:hypothetical protein